MLISTDYNLLVISCLLTATLLHHPAYLDKGVSSRPDPSVDGVAERSIHEMMCLKRTNPQITQIKATSYQLLAVNLNSFN